MIKICNDRSVFPNSVKISNQYENDTRSIDFDLSDVQFTGNTYLICKYQGQSTFYAPLLLDSNFSIPVETFLSAQPGAYTCVIVISTVTIDADYNFSSDNPLFVSNEFTLNVDPNFLTGTATAWELTPAAQNYFDQLIALVDKVQEDLDNGSFVGNGIKSITLISTVGLVDTYQILFTDNSTFDFQVTNGTTPTITIQDGVWFVNGISTGVSALGQKGDKGDPGVGIVSIEKTSTSGNVDTYTITFTNQTTSTFTVTNGTNGKDGITPNIQIGTVETLPAGSQATATITGTTEKPLLNLGIPEGETGGTTNYNDLENKPQINGVELSGNKSGSDVGLVNNQQGTANAGKVLGIGQDGLVIPVENAGASDNIIYKDIAKSLNPNITDSFLRAMWNLKLYGQSTQGADPSPSNPQPITAIEKFDGQITGDNLLNPNAGSEYVYNRVPFIQYTGNSYGLWVNEVDPVIVENDIFILNNITQSNTIQLQTKLYLQPNVEYAVNIYNIELTTILRGVTMYDENNNIIGGQWDNQKPFTTPSNCKYVILGYTVLKTGNAKFKVKVQVNNGNNDYAPFIGSQPSTYTPTNPMHSTQDGSISDYVDVEKGVEVYNIYKVVTKPQKLSKEGWFEGTGFIAYRTSVNMTPIANILSNVFVNSGNLGQKNNIYLSINDLPEDLKTLDAIVEYNQTNEIEFYVVLATPIETPIPQERLAMLRALYTYTGVTNFLCNAPVSFTYERSLQIVINNLENAVNTNALNIAIKE